jgi:radical SAM protein with 4Fe4S-binding SPASM domain
LYELNPEAFAYLDRCRAGSAEEADPDFIAFCLAEGILTEAGPAPRSPLPARPPLPSLRYLEVHLTARCNLTCRHCYLGAAQKRDLPWPILQRLLSDFEEVGGLRLLLSGGEPLLYPDFWRLNDLVANRAYRSVLLSNGSLLDRPTVRRLQVQEVQLSLDGLEPGHDLLRGAGSFRRTVAALDLLQEEGLGMAVATMVHAGNLRELADLRQFLLDRGVREWSVDLPTPAGRLAAPEVVPEMAAPYLDMAFGGGTHGAYGELACGSHLAAVAVDGRLVKCGFYAGLPGPAVAQGLRRAWAALPKTTLAGLACHPSCPSLQECRGGCRYRAEILSGPNAPDPVGCARFGQAAHKGQ